MGLDQVQNGWSVEQFESRWHERGILDQNERIVAVEVEDETDDPDSPGPCVWGLSATAIHHQPVDDPGHLIHRAHFGAWYLVVERQQDRLRLALHMNSGDSVLHEGTISNPNSLFEEKLIEIVGGWGKLRLPSSEGA
jgi:hypothetical protein